ncbi:hypothetical protein ES703_31708 [subsurface metagenome]
MMQASTQTIAVTRVGVPTIDETPFRVAMLTLAGLLLAAAVALACKGKK